MGYCGISLKYSLLEVRGKVTFCSGKVRELLLSSLHGRMASETGRDTKGWLSVLLANLIHRSVHALVTLVT